MIGRIATLALVAAAAPAIAQTPSAPAVAVNRATTPDAARIAAARRVIDQLWPMGTYRRLMDGTMADMVDAMMNQIYDMKARDVDPTATGPADETMGKALAAKDPHYRERMQLSTKAMFDAMLPFMDKIEPTVRSSMVTIYARKFSVGDLQAMEAFFATPAGRAYAREWLLSFMDPEIMKSMQSFTPELMREMPAIMKKIEAATAHLPPAPKPEKEKQ